MLTKLFGFLVVVGVLATVGLAYNARVSQPNSSPPPSNSNQTITFENQTFHYRFRHTDREFVRRSGPDTDADLTTAGAIMLVDTNNPDNRIFTLEFTNTPRIRAINNFDEAAQETMEYTSSSTSQYLYPETNQLVGPTKVTIRRITGSTLPPTAYRYEVYYRNSETEPIVTDVYLLIPVVVVGEISAGANADTNYSFLQIKYDKVQEPRVEPILSSLELTI